MFDNPDSLADQDHIEYYPVEQLVNWLQDWRNYYKRIDTLGEPLAQRVSPYPTIPFSEFELTMEINRRRELELE